MISSLLFILTAIFLEHADTPEKREQGLMGRKEIQGGMLFHFEKEGIYSFWSKNCFLSLSLAFMNEEGVIVEMADLIAYPERLQEGDSFFLKRAVYPKKRARYVLEVPKGWFKREGVEVGDRLSWEGERGFFSKRN